MSLSDYTLQTAPVAVVNDVRVRHLSLLCCWSFKPVNNVIAQPSSHGTLPVLTTSFVFIAFYLSFREHAENDASALDEWRRLSSLHCSCLSDHVSGKIECLHSTLPVFQTTCWMTPVPGVNDLNTGLVSLISNPMPGDE